MSLDIPTLLAILALSFVMAGAGMVGWGWRQRRQQTITLGDLSVAVGDDIVVTAAGGQRKRYRVMKRDGLTLTVRPR